VKTIALLALIQRQLTAQQLELTHTSTPEAELERAVLDDAREQLATLQQQLETAS
jgi:hypothetical protein